MFNNIIPPDKLEEIISFLVAPPLEGPLLIVKVIFIFFGIFFLGGAIYFFFTTSWFKKILLKDLYEVLTYRPYWLLGTKRKWESIEKRLKSGLESEYKLAVIEADDLLEKTLKQGGFKGDSLGERLDRVTKETLPNLEEVLEAHKVRNNIVHDPNYKLTLGEARRVIGFFEKALRDLESF